MDVAEKIFRRSLKKREKLKVLTRLAGSCTGKRVLELGCSAAYMSKQLHRLGGWWVGADMDLPVVAYYRKVNSCPAVLIKEKLPFAEGSFDLVVIPDYLEHVDEDSRLLEEIFRSLREEGELILTVPRDGGLVINRLRSLIGLKPEVYGHRRAGYSAEELRELLRRTGFKLEEEGAYSGFFTELWETLLNFFYFRLMGKGKKRRSGGISPVEERDFAKAKKMLFFYSAVYPLALLLKFIDRLLFFLPGHVLYAKAKKEGQT